MTHREIVEKMPIALAKRPRDERGYPVPWFAEYKPGRWDFNFVEPGKQEQALKRGVCWVCGERLSRPYAFVVGPMCAVNRTSAEPPSHVECAVYSAKACPFLARPQMGRGSENHPDKIEQAAPMRGIMLARNPGVALVWITENASYTVATGLFDIGDPLRVRWYSHSRKATREEVLASFESGLPALREVAEAQGGDSPDVLQAIYEEALELVPA